jgi:hypothetical protein
MSWVNYEQEVFEKENASIEGLTFAQVFTKFPEFVKFTSIWTEATGRWERWKIYVDGRLNEASKSTTNKLENNPAA